jgi:L-ribulose-5-phosphate 4-epimerase
MRMLDELKRTVCSANRALGRSGLAPLTWGNVSGMDRAMGLFAIKPSGVPYDELEPRHMVLVDLEGQKVEGKLNPSSDTPTHAVLYHAFPAAGGIVHTHSVYATMFAQALREIPCFGTTHADVFAGAVPLTRPLTEAEVQGDYEGNTGHVIAERFKGLDAVALPGVLVAHHGPFTWGKDAAKAVEHSIALEAIAKMAFGTQLLRPGAAPVPPFLLEKHYARKHGPKAYYGQKP